MKRHQIARGGQVILSEIWGKKGAIGFVPPEGDGALCTSHFFLFDVRLHKIEPAYLQAIFIANYLQPQLEKPAKGTTGYAAVRPHHLLSAKIPLPALEEQRRIATRIERILTRIEKGKKLRTEALREAESLFSRMLGEIYAELSKKWGTRKLVNISEQITDGTHKTPMYVSDGVPFLSVKDITSGEISFSNVRYITEEEHEQLIGRAKPQRDDVLFTKVGTTGYAKIIDVDREFSIFVSLCLIKLKKDIVLPKYIEYMLNSSSIRKLSEEYTRGIGNKNLVLKFINDFPIPVPSLLIQRHIVAYLDALKEKINELKELQNETEKEMEELVPSILDKAFEGEL